MSMWNSKTDLWGRKTRPSTPTYHKDTNGEIEKDEDYVDEHDKIKHLEAQIVSLEARLKEKCAEICGLQIQLKENTQFMQTVILELIQLKSYKPTTPEAKPSSALEKYIADKNAKSASSTAVAKLP